MKVESLGELSKLLDLLNKKGVVACKVDGLELSLSGNPQPSNYKRKQEEDSTVTSDSIAWEDLSAEEQLFYSVSGQVKPE